MGFFKHGVSVMTLFLLVIAISSYLNIGPLLFLLPVLWFYSFFHVHSLKHMPDEEFYALEDSFLMPFSSSLSDTYGSLDMKHFLEKYKKIIALALIILGGTMIWQNFFDIISPFLPIFIQERIWGLSFHLPQLLIGLLIFFTGIYLIMGKKKSLNQDERTVDMDMNPDPEREEPFSDAPGPEPNFTLPPALESHDGEDSKKGA